MNQYLMNQVTDWLSKPENQAKMAQTWPGKMVQSALHAAALPGEVYAGKTDPMSEDSIQRAFELAGNVTGSAFAKGVTPNAVGIGPTKLKAAVPETQGIRAYHGSPHDFEKFDLSKIGTGEGAQSYGHGLYFAENPAVAREYRDALTDPANIPLQFQGKPVDMIWNEGISERWADVVKKLKPNQVEDFQTIMGNLSQVNDLDQVKHVLASLNQTQKNMYRDLIAPALTKPEAPKGRMYEVDLRAKPEQFLDWDRPIKEQPEILNQLRQTSKKDSWLRDFLRMDLKDDPKINGDLFHDKLKYHFGGDQAAINPYLMDQGVTGIRYLDQGSRKTPDDLKIDLARATIKGDQEAIRQIQQQIKQSQQTSNYVVFDPSIINILRKYNTGGAVANAMRFANG